MMKESLVILTGPTAVGKTKLSIALAKAIGGEIISADSMQIYKHMDIGSAKICPKEMQGIPHYLVDELEPWEEFHVVRFQKMAMEAMEKIRRHGHIPILVGGTGFYIQAIVGNVDFTENVSSPYRRELEALAAEKGVHILHRELQKVDSASAAVIHENNVKRVIRALEFYQMTGRKISEHNEEQRKKESPYDYAYFVLNDDREKLYARIEQRIDEMVEQGLVEEVVRLKEMGCHQGMVSMQGLGYKEMLAYLDGTYSFQEALDILKRDTRRFAKRQLTWFRREQDIIWLHKGDYAYQEEKILAAMLNILKEKGIIR